MAADYYLKALDYITIECKKLKTLHSIDYVEG
jgi:hypothetical protein